MPHDTRLAEELLRVSLQSAHTAEYSETFNPQHWRAHVLEATTRRSDAGG